MALLSADDVLNKRFQPTKFREGYDQDEVDDFLDEVVSTLRAVYAENDELKAKLQAAEERVAELSAGAPTGEQPVTEAAPVEEAVEVAEEPAYVPEPEPQPEPQPQQFAQPQEAASGPESAAGMLALAQRLHDEYVANGREEADRIVAEARSQGDGIIKDAEDKRDQTLEQLEKERGVLEHKIDELRTFEREYRARLKSYLESLLSDVEQRASAANDL